jgi:hypothetical protein
MSSTPPTGIDRVELQESWIDAHAQVVAGDPCVARSMRRAVLNRVKPMPDAQPAFDAMGELGFLERSDVPAMRDYVAMMEERLSNLLDTDRSFLLLADAMPVRGSCSRRRRREGLHPGLCSFPDSRCSGMGSRRSGSGGRSAKRRRYGPGPDFAMFRACTKISPSR